MKGLKFILAGILFGIIMTKSEAVSWYRIQEMFRFQSFQMYGIIGTAVALGVGMVLLIKKSGFKDFQGNAIVFHPKETGFKRYLLGGIVFGLGWALCGACPGPMFVSLGLGYLSMLWVIGGAVFGTFLYGLIRNRLPH